MKYYILDENQEIRFTEDLMEFVAFYTDSSRRIIRKEEVGKYHVSTIFLGFDHSFTDGSPVLFETMVFSDDTSDEQWRYHTLEEAAEGHLRIVERLKKKCQIS